LTMKGLSSILPSMEEYKVSQYLKGAV
jgi:hypothetical protein